MVVHIFESTEVNTEHPELMLSFNFSTVFVGFDAEVGGTIRAIVDK